MKFTELKDKTNKPRTVGTGRRTGVVSVNMQWVDIKKNGYKFLLITDFLPISAHHGPSGFGVRRPHKKIGYKFLLIADIFPISAHHGPSGFVVRRPHQPSSSLYLVQPQCVLQMGKSPNPPYHLPFIDLRIASIKSKYWAVKKIHLGGP